MTIELRTSVYSQYHWKMQAVPEVVCFVLRFPLRPQQHPPKGKDLPYDPRGARIRGIRAKFGPGQKVLAGLS